MAASAQHFVTPSHQLGPICSNQERGVQVTMSESDVGVLTFADLLVIGGFRPSDVRLLRHQTIAPNGRTPFALWRDDLSAFEDYQAVQTIANRSKLAAPFWASFVASHGDTLFVGMYSARRSGSVAPERVDPLSGLSEGELGNENPDRYVTELLPDLAAYIGRLTIDWGPGLRSWVQRGDRKPKLILELRPEFKDPPYPGHSRLIITLSDVANLPDGWREVLRASRGVYLLTCPRTKEQYVGSACGENGFLGRWQSYLSNAHGGNIELKSREPSDYQVCILEVAGSSSTEYDIRALEGLWKLKLQSREMGLNRN